MKKKQFKVPKLDLKDKVSLYSISSSESDIRICYIINQVVGINLSLTEDIIVRVKSSQQAFKNYYYESEHGTEKYYLIINRNNYNYLIPELKKVDYLFLCVSETIITNLELFIKQIKAYPEISAVLKIDPAEIKSFNRIKF